MNFASSVGALRRRRRMPAEWALPLALAILVVGWIFKSAIGSNALPTAALAGAFVGFFVGAIVAAFAAVRHAEHLAHSLGEPYGTLVLTLAAVSLEVTTVVVVMLHGENDPVFARDTLFSVLMIVMNGVIGLGLLLGGIRHHEQGYKLEGAKAFLSVLIPLAVLALVLPIFTEGGGLGVHPLPEAVFLVVISLLLYAVFIAMQTRSHRSYFVAPDSPAEPARNERRGPASQASAPAEPAAPDGRKLHHAALLIVYLLLVVLTAKLFALPLDIGIDKLGMPSAAGALAVAILVLAPEAMAAISAARANEMQRSVNIGLGTALSTVSLTVPAVLLLDLFTGHAAFLGLNPPATLLLLLTFAVSILTFSSGRTNMLQGLVHIVLFLTYLVLVFSP